MTIRDFDAAVTLCAIAQFVRSNPLNSSGQISTHRSIISNVTTWIIADPDRDAFLNGDIEVVAEAERESEKISIGWTASATTEYLFAFVRQTGFTWDGWLLLSGDRKRETLPAAAQERFDSRTDLRSVVSAEACYPYGDGTGLIWVPKVSISEAEQLVSQDC